MGNLVDGLGQLFMNYPAWRLVIIGGSMLLQGELAVLLLMYFVLNHFLTFQEFVISALGTVFVAELFVYFFGRMMRGTRFGWKFYRKMKGNRRVQLYSYYLKKNIGKLLIVAKFLPATSVLSLLLTGWTRVKFGTFLKAYTKSLLFWFGSMTLVAYFLMSGVTYLKTSQSFRSVEIVIGGLFVLIFVAEHFIKESMNARFNLESKAEVIGKAVEEWEKNAPEIKNPADDKPQG